ncbi:hypothetical protein [Pseudoroseomonas sp. WGS1072]|uniref:hypothetical protein n=1 Tax=Roseomonas sp. WGS1072 TaxID=3366816 RepID=UPI003BF3A7EA
MTTMIAAALLASARPAASAASMGNSHISPSSGENMPSGHIYAPRGENPDVKLIALCRRYMVMEEAYNRCLEEMLAAEERGDQAAEDALSKEQDIRVPVMRDLLFDIMDIPARTAEGAKAKAVVALTKVQRYRDGSPYGQEDAIMDSLACDILSPGFALPTVSPFLELLVEVDAADAAVERAVVAHSRNEGGEAEAAELSAAVARYEAAMRRMAAEPARGALGLAVKGTIVAREAGDLLSVEGSLVADSLRADACRLIPGL